MGEEIVEKHFPGVERSSLLEIELNASLALTFGHPLIANGLRPVSHNYIHLGMMNCRQPTILDKDLKTYIDNSKQGVILVSFG